MKMNTKEIKIVYGTTREMCFYRMEGERWCLVDDSDDNLRKYIHTEIYSGALNEDFFEALRQASFAEDDERLVIWFEGTADDYSDFRESLDDCDLAESIRVKRVKPEPPELEMHTVDASAEPTSETETEALTEESPAQEEAFSEVPPAREVQEIEDDIPSVAEEEVDEETGILKYPGADAWSWRKKYPEVPMDAREALRIEKNTIIDQATTLVNRTIFWGANVSVIAKVECIHCTIYIERSASADILTDGELWLKHCIVKSHEPDNRWINSEERENMVIANGALHIYDSVIQDLEISDLVDRGGYAIVSAGVFHIVDTKIQHFKGNYIYLYGADDEDFCGSRISTDDFAGTFLRGGTKSITAKQRLEYCTFRFSKLEKFKRGLRGQQYKDVPSFMDFRSNVYFSKFIQTDDKYAWGKFSECIKIRDGLMQGCIFSDCGKMGFDGSTLLECKFAGCLDIAASPDWDAMVFEKCSFSECYVFDDNLIGTNSFYPSYTLRIEKCQFYRCIAKKLLNVHYEKELKKYRNVLIKDNVFRECITTDAMIDVQFNEPIKDSFNSRAENNKFYSCVCADYIRSDATYGLFKKPCSPVAITETEIIKSLSPWAEAMKKAKCAADVTEIEKAMEK